MLSNNNSLCVAKIRPLPAGEKRSKHIFIECTDKLRANGNIFPFHRIFDELDPEEDLFDTLIDNYFEWSQW